MCARLPSGRLYRCCPLIAFYSERAKPVPFSALYFAAHGLVYVCGMLQSRSKLASRAPREIFLGILNSNMIFIVSVEERSVNKGSNVNELNRNKINVRLAVVLANSQRNYNQLTQHLDIFSWLILSKTFSSLF